MTDTAKAWRLFDSILFALIAFVLATGVWEHYDAKNDNRRAIIKLAHAQCEANNVLEQASLSRSKSDAQTDRIHQFFFKFDAPINAALADLGAKPCS